MTGNRTVVEKDTKSMAGERVPPLPSLVQQALKTCRARQAPERLAAGEGYGGGRYVLANETGDALNGRRFRVRARYGLTGLWAQTASVGFVSTMLGRLA